MYCVGNRNWK